MTALGELSRLRASRVVGVVGSGSDRLERLRRGEEQAFDEVYSAFRPRLYGFLVRLCPNVTVAEDLLQETFMRLVVHRRDLPPRTDLAAWLFTVARNLAHSHGRWRVVGKSVLGALRASPPVATTTPLENAVLGQQLQSIARALASLSLRHREILLLVAVEGFSTHEAAGILELSQDALRQRLSRARGALASAMELDARVPARRTL